MEAFGYSHQEIADELGTTTKAVSSLLDREKRYIRESMAAEWDQEGRYS